MVVSVGRGVRFVRHLRGESEIELRRAVMRLCLGMRLPAVKEGVARLKVAALNDGQRQYHSPSSTRVVRGISSPCNDGRFSTTWSVSERSSISARDRDAMHAKLQRRSPRTRLNEF